MTVPANGIERLIHFVDRRIAQLNLSKEEVARRGGPNPDTLAKIRARKNARTPGVDTLLRLDQCLGWQPGSAAVTMLGGRPLSITAVGSGVGRPPKHEHPAQPVTENEILRRLADQFYDEIERLQKDLDETHTSLGARIGKLRNVYDHLAEELAVDGDLVAEYQSTYKVSTVRHGGRRPSSAVG